MVLMTHSGKQDGCMLGCNTLWHLYIMVLSLSHCVNKYAFVCVVC